MSNSWTRTPCPICGKLMNPRAASCRDCRSGPKKVLNYALITPEWLTCFAGFFMGEGTATLVCNKEPSIQARVSIALRSDDSAVLEDIQAHFGGGLYYADRLNKKSSKSSPQSSWIRSGLEDVDQICAWLQQYCQLPSKKLDDVATVREFIAWRLTQPYRGVDWIAAKAFRVKLLSSRKFSDNG